MPKTNYNQVSFWQQKYKVTICQHYQWLCKPQEIFTSIHQHLHYNKMIKVLQIGCGTSSFALKLKREVQARQQSIDITCIDFSKQLIKKYRSTKNVTGINYICADIKNLSSLPTQSYDYIFDKGCFDCLFCHDNFTREVLKGLRECYKLLKNNGKLIIISHAKPKLRTHLFRNKLVPFELKFLKIMKDNKNQQGCFAYICTKKVGQAEQNNNESGLILPQHQKSEQEQKQNQQKQNEDKPAFILQNPNEKKKKKIKQNDQEQANFILNDPEQDKQTQKKIERKKRQNKQEQAPFILPGQKKIVGDFILKEEDSSQQQNPKNQNDQEKQNGGKKEDKKQQKQSEANFVFNEAQYQNQFDDDQE